LHEVKVHIVETIGVLSKSRTAKLWLQYMKMVDILLTFIQAERTGDWPLHMSCLEKMSPFLAAAGHNLYTKSINVYLDKMSKLEGESIQISMPAF
jgi:hypothetical protein